MTYYNDKKNVGLWRAAKRIEGMKSERLKFDISYINQIPGSPIILEIEEISTIKNNQSNLAFQPLASLKSSFIQFTRVYNLLTANPQAPKIELYRHLSKWNEEIDKIISLSYYVVDLVNVNFPEFEQDHHVILEEIYAFDRVPQVLVISSIIMDPFYRSFDGLSILIEKEFIAFGHPFEDRCGFNRNKDHESSPIFIQLLECIHQLVITHPQYFEYSSSYLAKIAYEVYTTKYKNFCNKLEAKKEKLHGKCLATLWKDEVRTKNDFNYQYENNKNLKKELWEIRKKPSVKEYLIWTEYYDLICLMNGDIASKGNCSKEVEGLKKNWKVNFKSKGKPRN